MNVSLNANYFKDNLFFLNICILSHQRPLQIPLRPHVLIHLAGRIGIIAGVLGMKPSMILELNVEALTSWKEILAQQQSTVVTVERR